MGNEDHDQQNQEQSPEKSSSGKDYDTGQNDQYRNGSASRPMCQIAKKLPYPSEEFSQMGEIDVPSALLQYPKDADDDKHIGPK